MRARRDGSVERTVRTDRGVVRNRGVGAMLAGLALLTLSGCVTSPTVAAAPSAASAAASQGSATGSGGATTTATSCTPAARQSYAASTTSAYANVIKNRGYLLVGVSSDTRLLGAVNPADPTQFTGFDIDMARLVATQIFGSADDAHLKFKVISTAERTSQLQAPVEVKDNAKGGVDLVARAFTMTCDRWKSVAFSAEYLTAHQGILAPTAARVKSMADLKGKPVCATTGSTSLAKLQKDYPEVKRVAVPSHTDCLVLLQQGSVDAITGDNTILAGYQAQDPATEVVKSITLSDEPYGLAVSLEHKDFAAYLNAVLAKARTDGTWQKAYAASLQFALGAGTQPTPQYGRS